MDVFIMHTFLGGVFPRILFLGKVFLVDVLLRDEFEVPLEDIFLRVIFFGTCLGCLLDPV